LLLHGFTFLLYLLANLLGFMLGLPHNIHVVEDLGGPLFGGGDDLLGDLFGILDHFFFVHQQLSSFLKGGRQIEPHQVELIEQLFLINHCTAAEGNARTIQDDFFQLVEFALDIYTPNPRGISLGDAIREASR
jgi:hypothetical protein